MDKSLKKRKSLFEIQVLSISFGLGIRDTCVENLRIIFAADCTTHEEVARDAIISGIAIPPRYRSKKYLTHTPMLTKKCISGIADFISAAYIIEVKLKNTKSSTETKV